MLFLSLLIGCWLTGFMAIPVMEQKLQPILHEYPSVEGLAADPLIVENAETTNKKKRQVIDVGVISINSGYGRPGWGGGYGGYNSFGGGYGGGYGGGFGGGFGGIGGSYSSGYNYYSSYQYGGGGFPHRLHRHKKFFG